MSTVFESGGPKFKPDRNTVTNLPFRHRATVHKRYELINRPSTDDRTDEKVDTWGQAGGEYVSFLHRHKRTCTNAEGFLDSSRRKNAYRTMSLSGSLGDGATRRQMNFQSVRRPKTAAAGAARDAEHRRRMHAIESHMYKHKQDERNLNRLAYDVGKSKVSIERIKKKIIEEGEKMLDEQNEKIAENKHRASAVRAQGVKTKSNFNKNRVHDAHVDLQRTKHEKRQSYKLLSDKEREYALKSAELEGRRKRMEELRREAEERIRREEVEANSIQKELAELALHIGMEGIKSKSNNYDFERSEKNKILKHFNEDSEIENKLLENLKNTSLKIRRDEFRKRQASARSQQKLERVEERLRDGERKLKDMKQLVSNNVSNQKRLMTEREDGKLERRKNLLQEKIETGHGRKVRAVERAKTARRRIGGEREGQWSERYRQVRDVCKIDRNKELIRGLRKVVRCDGEKERRLEQALRRQSAEARAEEGNVRKLQEELVKTRARLDRSTQKAVAEANAKTRDLESRLMAARSRLMRKQNQANGNQLMLRKYECSAKESRMMCGELEKNHQRLLSISKKTSEGK